MAILYSNNAYATLAAGINSSATALTVASGLGARFPAISGSDFFYVTLVDSVGNLEIVKVTARATDAFTIVRAQDSTTAQAFSLGDGVQLRIIKALLDVFPQTGGALGTPSSATLTSATGLPISTGVSGLGTGVATALGVNTGTAGAFVVNGGALGSPSTAGTIPAFTLGGTVSGGGNQINNVIIGNSSPLAGAFTTVTASSNISADNAFLGGDLRLPQTGRAIFNGATASDYIIGPTSGTINSYIASSLKTSLTSTGLAVTGELSATGQVTASGATNGFVTDATNGYALFSGDPANYNISRNSLDIQIKSASTIGALISGTRILSVSSTGLAVTGALSATGSITSAPTAGDGSVVVRGFAGSSSFFQLTEAAVADRWTIGVAGSSDTLQFRSGSFSMSTGTQRMTLTAAGTLSGGTSGTGYSFSGSAPATSLTLDSSGNLGIGRAPTAAGTYKMLELDGATGGYMRLYAAGTLSGYFYSNATESGIGAVTSAPFLFYTNNTERARIDSSGNLGIGTSSPAYPLDVTKAGGGNFVANFQNTTAATPYGVQIKDAASSTASYPLFQVTNSAASLAYFRVDSGTGNIGIGTNSPATIVHAVATGGAIRMQDSTATAKYIQMRSDSTNSHLEHVGGPGDALRINNQVAGTIEFFTSNTERMRLDSSGNLGIGTSLPTYKLDVVGTIAATQNSAGLAGNFVNSDATNGYGVSIAAGGTSATRYSLVVRNPAGTQDWFKVSSVTGEVGNSIFAPGAPGSSEIARFTTTGLGIGTNAPLAKLQIDSGDIRLQGGAAGKILFFSTGNGVSQNATLEVQNDGGTTNTGEFRFSTRNVATTLAERVRITAEGNLLVGTTAQGTIGSNSSFGAYNSGYIGVSSTGDSVFSRRSTNGDVITFRRDTSSVGAIAVTTTGVTLTGTNGITFTAAQTASADANTLDDYEEGTWPVTAGGITVNSGTPVYSGTYVKIGKLVNITIAQSGGNITLTGGGTSTFTGLPFNPGTLATAPTVWADSGTGKTGTAYPYEGGNVLYILEAISTFTNLTALRITATYQV